LARRLFSRARAFASFWVVGVSDIPSLIVASADLKVVQLLRDAIRTADIHSGKRLAVSKLGPAPTEIRPRFKHDPEPEILPRKRIDPVPRIEPRKVVHPVDRFEPREAEVVLVPVPVYVCKKSPIEPPWKVLPWELPLEAPVRPQVKLKVRPPDIVHKGSLIDFFI
jgi:hypothetical protein